MKRARKLVAFLLATLMVMSMSMGVLAEAEKCTITITEGADGSVYAGYKLLDVTVGTTAGDEKTYAYTVNDTYLDVLKSVTNQTTEEKIIEYIEDLRDDEVGMRDFADAVYAAITEGSLPADIKTTDNDNTTDADESATKNIFENVDQGYYLIAETQTGSDADTFSLVMLNTAGQSEVAIETKEDVPTVTKKISEGNATADYTSAAVGDTISFEITGTVSSKYADYESYYYCFMDTLSPGLTLNQDSIKIYVDGNVGQDITDQFNWEKTENSFTAKSNLKEIASPTITAGSTIVVKYTATLNEGAVSTEEGNKNTVVLEYENDPYHADDDGDTDPKTPNKPTTPGETPEDVNVVFTYDVVVKKVDGSSAALNGAGFKLYKKDGESWIALGEEQKGEDISTFTFEGLDADVLYKLEESTVPAGYNKADDIIFKIVPSFTEADPVELESVSIQDENSTAINTFNTTDTLGTATVNVQNLTGSILPSTGGMGTTIFYIVGGVLVLVAVVLLVTRKRMKEEDV